MEAGAKPGPHPSLQSLAPAPLAVQQQVWRDMFALRANPLSLFSSQHGKANRYFNLIFQLPLPGWGGAQVRTPWPPSSVYFKP